jgi:8-oxo-dGTP pyrophosphatase MutT (NUDIX family)
LLRRKLPLAQPLSERLKRLQTRLSARQAVAGDADPALIRAAVALVISPSPDSLLLIRRADREGDPWSGHMALPGGRREPEDLDLLATVIREVSEEVGMPLDRGQLVSPLDDVIPRTPTLPPVAVRPYLFQIPSRPPLVLNSEVSSAAWVPIDLLLDPQTYRSVRLELRGETRDFPAYHLEDAFVWGMTERILTGFLDEFRHSEP